MLFRKEEYARKRIHNGCLVRIEIQSLGITVRQHSASLVMPNSYPHDGIFRPHLMTIKDSYNLKRRADLSQPIRKGYLSHRRTAVAQNIRLVSETFKTATCGGVRWLSGRVSDSGARGRGFETYRRRVVSLSKTLYSPKVLVNYPGSGDSVPTWLKNCWLGR